MILYLVYIYGKRYYRPDDAPQLSESAPHRTHSKACLKAVYKTDLIMRANVPISTIWAVNCCAAYLASGVIFQEFGYLWAIRLFRAEVRIFGVKRKVVRSEFLGGIFVENWVP